MKERAPKSAQLPDQFVPLFGRRDEVRTLANAPPLRMDALMAFV